MVLGFDHARACDWQFRHGYTERRQRLLSFNRQTLLGWWQEEVRIIM